MYIIINIYIYISRQQQFVGDAPLRIQKYIFLSVVKLKSHTRAHCTLRYSDMAMEHPPAGS